MAATFRDSDGRDWELSITAGSLKRVREMVGVNLWELSPQTFRQLRDTETLINTIYAIVKPLADVRGVSDEEFGRSLALAGPDAVLVGVNAFIDAVIEFHPNAQREFLRKIEQSVEKVMRRGTNGSQR